MESRIQRLAKEISASIVLEGFARQIMADIWQDVLKRSAVESLLPGDDGVASRIVELASE